MSKKLFGLLVYLIIYVIEFAIGVLTFIVFHKLWGNTILAVFLSDIITTVFIWLTSLIMKSPSIYDPYWSVQPLFYYLLLIVYFNNWNLGSILFLGVLGFYSIRLTINFCVGFNDIHYVDWRYKMLKEKSGSFFQFVNLFGICMFPTLLVFFGSVPFIYYASSVTFNYFQIIGAAIMVIATLLELIPDIQMKQFIKNRKDRSETINQGLWKYSRHPNYLGEVMLWYGIALFFILPTFERWYLFAGAILITLLFLFISIPMEEKHMVEYKPSYKEYQKTTSMFLLLPKRKEK